MTSAYTEILMSFKASNRTPFNLHTHISRSLSCARKHLIEVAYCHQFSTCKLINMEPSTDLQEPDEARPAKRVRLEAPLGITEDVQEEIADDDDWDSIYGNADDGGVAVNTVDGAEEEVPAPATSEQPVPESSDRTSPLPSELAAKKHVEQAQAAAEQEREKQMEVEVEVEVEDGVPADAIDDGEEFVAEQEHVVSTDEPSSRMLDDTVDVDTGEAPEIEMKEDGEAAGDAEAQTAGTEDEGTT